jgi:hypothetical protein
VPPRDPRLCPDLERAMPADAVTGRTRVADRPVLREVLFGDGEWHLVRVRSWAADRQGRDVIAVEWYAQGSTWGESYIVADGKVREPE